MTVRVEVADHVATVTLDDPDRLNAMTVAMGEALEVAFADLAADPSVRCVVLTGRGRAFSAGGDLAMLEDFTRRAREEGFDAAPAMRAFYRRFLGVRDHPVPVVAAINGAAVGAGLCVALACDLRLVAQDATVGLNFATLGLHPGMGGSWLLPRAVGDQVARRLLYTGELLRGTEAAALGLALEAVPADDVLPRATDLARRIATSAPLAVRQVKATLADDTRTLGEQLEVEAAMQAENYAGDELVEGLAAVRERRAPRH